MWKTFSSGGNKKMPGIWMKRAEASHSNHSKFKIFRKFRRLELLFRILKKFQNSERFLISWLKLPIQSKWEKVQDFIIFKRLLLIHTFSQKLHSNIKIFLILSKIQHPFSFQISFKIFKIFNFIRTVVIMGSNRKPFQIHSNSTFSQSFIHSLTNTIQTLKCLQSLGLSGYESTAF